jgi:hypothetical protein
MTTQQPLLDLDGVKSLYKKGVEYAKKKYNSIFFDRDDKMFDYQLKLMDNAKDITTVMDIILLPNNTFSTAFQAPKDICSGCELQNTGIQFGVGNVGWYFLYGIVGEYTFNITFFRLEIAPPDVVGIDRSEAVRWGCQGGYGEIKTGVWHTIQHEWLYMKYNQDSYSTFELSGSGNNVSAVLSTKQSMQFNAIVNFRDSANVLHNLDILMVANTPPLPNFPNGCDCGYDLGTLYYSYPDMNVSMSVNNGTIQSGYGWIDHQNMKGGIPKGNYIQALETVENVFAKQITSGWLWFSIQDRESGKQYMLSHSFGTKFYENDIKLNQKIPLTMINIYEKGTVKFEKDMSKIDVVMVETQQYVFPDGTKINLPSKYNIEFPDGKKVVFAIATKQLNVYDFPLAPYETPALLYDSTGTKIIGSGLIEANLYLDNNTLAKKQIKSAGGDPTNVNDVNTVIDTIVKKQKTWQKILAFIIVLFPLWIILLSLLFIFYKKDNRMVRVGLSVALLLLMVMVM